MAFALQRDPLGQTDKSIPANISLFKVQGLDVFFLSLSSSDDYSGNVIQRPRR